ncbi:myoD family inhibitor domain-containing protein 2 [Ascaphus truei]|uniref:myoD family inhibitor domain-containing protein 2 n=1 Tax=Ascaphus truei TaxID=8439 RepID=UPI003F590607
MDNNKQHGILHVEQMSETKVDKGKIKAAIIQNDQENVSWLKEEKHPASGSAEDKSRKENAHQHLATLTGETEDESFQEPSHEKKTRHGTFSSSDECNKILPYDEENKTTSHQTDNEGECASLILACLFCHFCDFLVMLPNACESMLTNMCCPSHRYHHTSDEDLGNDCNCNCDFDCGLFDVCQESSECLELALEISEICYH